MVSNWYGLILPRGRHLAVEQWIVNCRTPVVRLKNLANGLGFSMKLAITFWWKIALTMPHIREQFPVYSMPTKLCWRITVR